MNYEEAKELYKQTYEKIRSNEEQWQNYLDFSSRNYRYSFDDKIMIYAQNPNATAVASMDIWNNKMSCWIKKHSKAIKLIVPNERKLKFVFDQTQVYKRGKEGHLPKIWQMNPEYEASLINRLESIYGKTDETKSFGDRIYEISSRVAHEMYDDMKSDASTCVNDFNIDDLVDITASSIEYSVLKRCNIDTSKYNFDFSKISSFNTNDTLTSLVGETYSDMSHAILHEMARTTVKLDVEKEYKRQHTVVFIPEKLEEETKYDNQFYVRDATSKKLEEITDESSSDVEEPIPDSIEEVENIFLNTDEQKKVIDENIASIKENEVEENIPNEDVKEDVSAEAPASEDINEDIKKTSPEKNKEVEKAENFTISSDTLGEGTPKEKYKANVEAIKTLKNIESNGRTATKEEQEILSKYVGWGGLADAFDPDKSAWNSEYNELKELLTDDEYSAAKSSTLNAHYTQPPIIKGIYNTLARLGFKKGNVLEPSMGIGNFFGLLPNSLNKSKLYGIELDSITGRIAKQLYPNAKIEVGGYEQTSYPDNFFDVAVGNVPFGDYKVYDKQYNKLNFLIHDYFFAKTLDKVRSGGVVAFVTSMGTMDKKSESVRRYLAERAELVGAVRLPNNAFKNAGTEVTTDIIFLKKRDAVRAIDEPWIHTSVNENGIEVNSYFAEHPEMIVGNMEQISSQFGLKSACIYHGNNFEEDLNNALSKVEGNIGITLEEADLDFGIEDEISETLPASPEFANYSYAIIDDKVYFRKNSIMEPVNSNQEDRIKGLIGIRDATHDIMNLQLYGADDDTLHAAQEKLNKLYDSFAIKFGRIASRTNSNAFNQDSSYFLLTTLEKYDDGKYVGKADIFNKRTIRQKEEITAENPAQALAASLIEKGNVDLDYMSELINMPKDEIKDELTGIIFKDPITHKYLTSDEYLSGDVREKLEQAQKASQDNPEFEGNVKALEKVLPKDLDASEIDIRLGATWIDPKYIDDFIFEKFNVSYWRRGIIKTEYSKETSTWNIQGKKSDPNNSTINTEYGTDRINGLQLLENALNLKDTKIKDKVTTEDGEKYVTNQKATLLATTKQDDIKEAFKNWVFKDPERRRDLVTKYNRIYNAVRPREFDGSFLKFNGMASDIELKDHQKNAVAHMIYGENTLLAHCVGAGKTFEMTTAAMEMKRIGLCSKSLFVVPNHLTEQWGHDFLRLYPSANILVATKKDFEPANRKKFCARIATGNYDAVIIGHTQFEKIPLSQERQMMMIKNQLAELDEGLSEAKHGSRDNSFTVKQLEKSKKSLQSKLLDLTDAKKDDVVTFEQLGVDRLFVDESHNFKNLYLYTKMSNLSGLQQTEAKKSQDMYMKCQYIDEITNGKGITFATGTPISNSMTELYTNMRYLQSRTLKKLNLNNFDAWASTFGETTTGMELSPEGTGFRLKTRFAKFFNLPELTSLFKESADIKTPDMLNLPVPDVEYHNVVIEPTEVQRDMLANFAKRADLVRIGAVSPEEDNMLKITNDGRKMALDQRLMNDLLPDENSKSSACVENAFKIYQDTMDTKSTQVIFCDLSTPKGDGTFNVYDDIKKKLIEKGVPEKEIAFIHDAKTEKAKEELFQKVNKGQVRFILGSTAKMGAGTNIQHKLIALHHMDCPWRPADLEQREGRIIRQGNENRDLGRPVQIFRYVTKDTFDAYSWQIIEQKQKFISQIMTSKSPVRSCEDVDEAVMSAAEVKALCTGNPAIAEKMQLDMDVAKLKLAKANHQSQQYKLEDCITNTYPKARAYHTSCIKNYEKDIATWSANKPTKESFKMNVMGISYSEQKEAGSALLKAVQEKTLKRNGEPIKVGDFAGFELNAKYISSENKYYLSVNGASKDNYFEVANSEIGILTRISNYLNKLDDRLTSSKQSLEDTNLHLKMAEEQLGKPFPQEDELNQKEARILELEALLNQDAPEESKEETKDLSEDKSKDNNFKPKHDDTCL